MHRLLRSISKINWIFQLIFLIGFFILIVSSASAEDRTNEHFLQRYGIDIILVVVAVASAIFAYFTHRRSQQLFIGQRRPFIQVRPIAIKEHPDVHGVETVLAIGNYSGFTAHEISFDVKYGNNDFIVEWIKANTDNIKKKGKKEQDYYLISQGIIEKLKPCKSIKKPIRGALKLDNVCRKKEIPVIVKAVWKNDKELIFEKRWEYRLICTTVGEGRSFDFSLQKVIAEDF